MKTGVLLINLGTPDSPSPKDVKNYLAEFLTDPRVIDIPWLPRQCLVRGSIIPKRYKESAACYKKIWTEEGSPLLTYSKKFKIKLEESLKASHQIELAMRYLGSTIQENLNKLKGLNHIIIFPQFPQYASATTGTIYQEVMKHIMNWPTIPKLSFINSFPTNHLLVKAFADLGKQCGIENYDHVLFSFHGLPERQLTKSDRHNHCLKTANCCHKISNKNTLCYSAQCHATANAIAQELQANKVLSSDSDSYTVCFQSRLGKEEWLKPYFSDILKTLAKQGKKKVLVFSPSFTCDCIETIHEIGVEYKEEFITYGGEILDLVPSLNAHPLWIEGAKELILEHSKSARIEEPISVGCP